MFMYLHLSTDEDGKVHATVQNHGTLKVGSLGGPTSQPSSGPFAVFKIESLEGADFLSDETLITLLFGRFTTKELMVRLQLNLSTDELLDILRERLKRPQLDPTSRRT